MPVCVFEEEEDVVEDDKEVEVFTEPKDMEPIEKDLGIIYEGKTLLEEESIEEEEDKPEFISNEDLDSIVSRIEEEASSEDTDENDDMPF
jgi:hypothetical protein